MERVTVHWAKRRRRQTPQGVSLDWSPFVARCGLRVGIPMPTPTRESVRVYFEMQSDVIGYGTAATASSARSVQSQSYVKRDEIERANDPSYNKTNLTSTFDSSQS